MILNQWDKYRDEGLLALRIGISIAFILHGLPKLIAGPELWAQAGGAIGMVGISFAPAFWGFMAAMAEMGGGILLAIGFLTRPAVASMFFTMMIATIMHLKSGDSFSDYSHALESGILFFSLLFIGPGRHSLDAILSGRTATDGASGP